MTMFLFQLNMYDPVQAPLAEVLRAEKGRRNFSRTIREALFLYYDLKRGNVELLAEMFPRTLGKLIEYNRLNEQ